MERELETAKISFDSTTGVGLITFNRPDSLNALNKQLRTDIKEALRYLEQVSEDNHDNQIRAVIIGGADGNFSVGADMHEVGDRTLFRQSEPNHYELLLNYPIPLIAKIRGYCLGGGFETALCCDIRLAHEDTSFGFPEVNLGMIPGAGGIQFISQEASPAVAREIAMTGEHISAKEAKRLGIVNKVFSDDEFDDEVRRVAETIAAKPPLAVQAIKMSTSFSESLEEGRKFDGRQNPILRNTDDHKEAMKAFAEDDYQPNYEGK